MTILEKHSYRRKIAILSLVKKGEYSAGYELDHVEDLHKNGQLTDNDYEELAEHLENLLNEETMTEDVTVEEVVAENETAENTEEEAE